MRRCGISFTSSGSACPIGSASVVVIAMLGLSVAEEHLGEAAPDQDGSVLVLGPELGDHVGLAAPLVLVDHASARACAGAGPDRLHELELHLGVQPAGHRV